MFQAVLFPIAALYGSIAALRRRLFSRGWIASERLTGTVISVGNLCVGGRGKTPVAAWLAETIRDQGFRVSILSRGYGGSYAGDALLVSDGKDVLADASVAGDEPVMLARRLRGVFVAVARRRARAGRLIEARFGPCVHVLDDGFQHLSLARDLDVVCLEPKDMRGKPLPAGRLRERPSVLGRADVALVSGGAIGDDGAYGSILDLLGHDRVFAVRRRPDGFYTIDGRAHPAPRRPLLLAAIAEPERFFDAVSRTVLEVAERVAFRDHHRFQARDLARVVRLVAQRGADAVVTTEKDLVRLPPTPAFGVPLLALRTSIEIDESDRLRALLLDRVRARGRGQEKQPGMETG